MLVYLKQTFEKQIMHSRNLQPKNLKLSLIFLCCLGLVEI